MRGILLNFSLDYRYIDIDYRYLDILVLFLIQDMIYNIFVM